MLFGKDPKESVADLFDRKKEVKELENALRLGERLNVVYGVRRTGKTSLIRAVLNEREWPYTFIDAREIYLKHNSVPIEALADSIAKGFAEFPGRVGMAEAEGDTGEGMTFEDEDITNLLKRIDGWCKGRKLRFVLATDEAQYLRFSGSVKYDMLMAWSVDNLPNIIYVLSGSEIGTLRDFLNYDDAKAPLYGRFRNDIQLGRLSEGESEEFLKEGFAELGRKVSREDIDDAAGKLGGTIGWLSYYGYHRGVKGLGHSAAIDRVFEEGCALVRTEVESLLKYSKRRYLFILKAIASGQNKWSEIKPYVIAKNGKGIEDSLLNLLLQNLVKFGIVDKDELRKEYSIRDPIVAYAVRKMR